MGDGDAGFSDFADEDLGEGVADAGVCTCYYCCWHGGGDGNPGVVEYGFFFEMM